jgi:hypothetical protein
MPNKKEDLKKQFLKGFFYGRHVTLNLQEVEIQKLLLLLHQSIKVNQSLVIRHESKPVTKHLFQDLVRYETDLKKKIEKQLGRSYF